MSQFEHLQPEAIRLMKLSKSDRINQLLSPRFIEHDELIPVMKWLEFESNRPSERQARGHAIYGKPGLGKSLLSKAITRRFGTSSIDEAVNPSQHVARIEMTGAREARTIYERILKCLGVPDSDQYRGDARERMVIKISRAARLRMLVLDEFQDILNSTPRQHKIALETLKFLFNVLNLSIVAIGTNEVPHAMRADEHLASRFSFTELSMWRDGERLRRFLAAYERSLPLHFASNLSSPDMSAILTKVGDETLRSLTSLLSLAAVHAVQTGTEKINVEMVELARSQPPRLERSNQSQRNEPVEST